MKKLIGAAGAVVIATGAVIVAAVAAAGVGDIFYAAVPTAESTLSAGDKTLLSAAVADTWPAIAIADLALVECKHPQRLNLDRLVCWVGSKATLTDAQFATCDINGSLDDPKSASAIDTLGSVELDEDQKALWDAFTESAMGLDLSLVYWFKVRRDPDTPATIYESNSEIKTVSPAAYRAERQSDPSDVWTPLGVVQ
jgi:hypothetical protein